MLSTKSSSKLGSALQDLKESSAPTISAFGAPAASSTGSPSPASFLSNTNLAGITPTINGIEYVLIDAISAIGQTSLADDLRALGSLNVSEYGRVVSGLVPVSALNRLEEMTSLQLANAALRVRIKNRSQLL